jgi:hypothetical protein
MSANATRAALELMAKPHATKLVQRGAIPSDILVLIKAASGDKYALRQIALSTSLPEVNCRKMAIEYLQKILFDGIADDYRLLGLQPGAKLEQINQHKRWLLRWLHPDLNPNERDHMNFRRVTEAATRLTAGSLFLNLNTAIHDRPVMQNHILRDRQSAKVRQRKMLPLMPRVFRRLRQVIVLAMAIGALVFLAYHFQDSDLPRLTLKLL